MAINTVGPETVENPEKERGGGADPSESALRCLQEQDDGRRVRQMKKKILISLLMAVVMAAALMTGCGSEQSADQSADQSGDNGSLKVDSKEIGSWVKIKKRAEADNKKHTAKFKITKIVTDEAKVAKAIEKYNNSGTAQMLDTAPGNDKLQYCIAKYNVYFPESFPDSDFGLTNVTVKFEVKAPDGGDEIKADGTVYKKLANTVEIGAVPQGYDFYSGQTYKGKVVYMIPKGSKDYLLKAGGYYFKPEKQ